VVSIALCRNFVQRGDWGILECFEGVVVEVVCVSSVV